MRRFLLAALLLATRAVAQNCADPGVRIIEEKHGSAVTLAVETTNCLDITVTLTGQFVNFRSTPALPLTIDTHGRRYVTLATLEPAGPGQWHWNYHYEWRYGGRGGQPDGTVYALPYAVTVHHKLIQGYHGSFSHQAGSPNDYALDWAMDEGSTVLAARAGVVVGVRQDSHVGGTDEKYKNCANYVIVRHADGTYGEYLHLQTGGALVKPGDTVKAGQPLAHSGNTGFSSQPHLHFAVFRTLDGNTRETLPVKFQTRDGNAGMLQPGKTY